EKQPWLVGCNYLPATAINDVEMWQSTTFDPATIERELCWAEQWGFNTLRVFLNYVVWEHEPEVFKRNFARFLEIAARHKMRVMPVLFDDCNFSPLTAKIGPQPQPIPWRSNYYWVSSPPFKFWDDPQKLALLKKYAQDIIKTFANDERIVIWDLYNEPGNGGRKFKHWNKVLDVFAWAREVAPTQPLTMGYWSWNDRERRELAAHSDVVSFHSYLDVKRTERAIIEAQKSGRPLFCTEWLYRHNKSNTVFNFLPLFKKYKVGSYNWGFVWGKTNTVFHWKRIEPAGATEPVDWQHDFLRPDGTVYRPEELALFRKLVLGEDTPANAHEQLLSLLKDEHLQTVTGNVSEMRKQIATKKYLFIYEARRACGMCKKFIPEFNEWIQKHGGPSGDFAVLFINADMGVADADVLAYMREMKMPFLGVKPSAAEAMTVLRQLVHFEERTSYLPQLVLFDADDRPLIGGGSTWDIMKSENGNNVYDVLKEYERRHKK
ncbi:MAG: cellulase family glycosylhydrolase, partial [Puniceicoccales bacterium]|nr:cellulase family glycosylhydrolase [Puniceicoccales bacterium]